MYNDWNIQIIKQGEEKMDNFEQRTWSDTTPGKSYIERLNFDPDRYWTTVRIEILGKTDETTYDLNLNLGGVKVKNYNKDNLRNMESLSWRNRCMQRTIKAIKHMKNMLFSKIF